MLDENIIVDAVAVILPHNKRPADAVRKSLRIVLISPRGGKWNTARSPDRISRAVYPLAEDLIFVADATILPNQNCAMGAIRYSVYIPLIAGIRADRHSTIRAAWPIGQHLTPEEICEDNKRQRIQIFHAINSAFTF